MATSVNYLSEIQTGETIKAIHVNQFVNALSGSEAYDISISGSLTLTGSVQSQDGYTGSLLGDVTGTADTGSKANNILISNNATIDNDYRIAFISPTSITNPGTNFYAPLATDSGSDGSGLSYNPSTDVLTVGRISGSNDGSAVDFVGTASHALNAGTFTEYITASYNDTTIYPQKDN